MIQNLRKFKKIIKKSRKKLPIKNIRIKKKFYFIRKFFYYFKVKFIKLYYFFIKFISINCINSNLYIIHIK